MNSDVAGFGFGFNLLSRLNGFEEPCLFSS